MQNFLNKTILVVIFLSLGTHAFAAACVSVNGLPDAKCTPGAVRSATTLKDICTANFTSQIRNVPDSLKKKVYASYGMTGNDKSKCPQGYEVDHLVSLVLSGDNVQTNLWPQSYCGAYNAHNKDKLENYLHRAICKGQITVAEAVKEISTNWIAAYKKYGLDKSGNQGTVTEYQK